MKVVRQALILKIPSSCMRPILVHVVLSASIKEMCITIYQQTVETVF